MNLKNRLSLIKRNRGSIKKKKLLKKTENQLLRGSYFLTYTIFE
jgi:hypothetical protein